jgi:vacuolar protein sorting-associated protein 13A/C
MMIFTGQYEHHRITISVDIRCNRVPRFNLKLRAPIELENLLPYDIQYRIYDKNTDQNWKSFLRKGGVMPVHSVELGHLVLLNIEIQDTGNYVYALITLPYSMRIVFKPSDFAIISTDRHSDFSIESRLSLRDPQERKLDLKLNYM